MRGMVNPMLGTAAQSAAVEGGRRIGTNGCSCSVGISKNLYRRYSQHSISSFLQEGAAELVALRLVAKIM